MTQIAIIMPAYQPDDKALVLLDELMRLHTGPIIVVDDGSDTSYIFNKMRTYQQVTVLTHAVNQGKGRALKTAFHYVCNECPDVSAVVTIDADGQHRVDDVLRVVRHVAQNEQAIVLGVRNFSQKGIPFRSKFGNEVTRLLFRFMTGTKLADTQTGLRGIPVRYLPALLAIEGERFEYEMNMLAKLKDLHIELQEIPIATVYIENNRTSHFRPLHDSFQIYKIFVLYALVSGASFLLDLALFIVFAKLFKIVAPMSFLIIATVLARVLSSLFNYYINRHTVFKSGTKKSFIRYYILAIGLMVISASTVQVLYSEWFQNGEVLLKVLVDTALFLLAFVVQRKWVFKQEQYSLKDM